MRVVVRPHHALDIHVVLELERGVVVLEGEVDVLAEVLARHLLELAAAQPVAVALVGVIHAVHEVGDPAPVGLDGYDPQTRVAHEDAVEDEHAHEVLVAPDDRHEAVDLRAPKALLEVLPRSEDVEARDESELHYGIEEFAVPRVVVVLFAGEAGQHHAAEPLCTNGLELAHAFRRGPDRHLADPDEPVRIGLAELDQPAVVRLHARLLQIEVRDVAKLHADGGIQDLGRDPVLLLRLDAGVRVPAAAVQLLEPRTAGRELFGRLPGGGDEGEGNDLGAALDPEHVAPLLVVHQHRCAVAELRVDPVDVAVRRLTDVAVGGDDGLLVHTGLLLYPGVESVAPACRERPNTSKMILDERRTEAGLQWA